MAVTAETTGGNTITCEDVYGPSWDQTEPCYNYIDSRAKTVGGEPAQAFPFPFSRFPGGRKVLLIVYGFDNADARGPPIGVVCQEVDVPEAGTGTPLDVSGDMMRRIQ